MHFFGKVFFDGMCVNVIIDFYLKHNGLKQMFHSH